MKIRVRVTMVYERTVRTRMWGRTETVISGLLKGLAYLGYHPTHHGASLQQTPFWFVSMICNVVLFLIDVVP